MNILVTGGAGFIGSHVAELFIDSGHRVVIVDDLSTGRQSNLPAKADFEQFDIREPAIEILIEGFRPDVVAHLAAQIDVRKSVADPILDADINVGGTVRIARAATRAGCRKIIFASTGGAIYGEQDSFPASEAHACRPVSPYGTAKFCAEQYLAHFERAGGPKAVCLRFANVYGPRQDPHGEAGVVAIFCRKLLAGEPPVIYGDGSQTRDYVFVGDVARAFTLALEAEVSGVFNIGTGLETDVNQLARGLGEACGFTGDPIYEPAREGEQFRSCIDPSLAATELAWTPEVDLSSGLARTVRAFREPSEG
jgi:UDP-glucose 4-epimerase